MSTKPWYHIQCEGGKFDGQTATIPSDGFLVSPPKWILVKAYESQMSDLALALLLPWTLFKSSNKPVAYQFDRRDGDTLFYKKRFALFLPKNTEKIEVY